MRRFVSLSLAAVAGCAFTPSGERGGDDQLTLDGAVGIDGSEDAVSTSIDAPACADTDGDGLCNDVDAWPCGATAPAIAPMVATGTDVWGQIADVSIAGGGNTAVVQPGAQLSYTLTWSLRDSDFICTSCQDQIEVGLVPGGRQRCVYDDNPPQNQTLTGSTTVTMTAPSAPGVYALRFQLARDFSCNAFGRTGWWIGEPGNDRTFGILCVP